MILGIRHVGFGYTSIQGDFYEKLLGFKKIWDKNEDGEYIGKIWGIQSNWVNTQKFQAPDGSVIECIHKPLTASHINFNHIALITDNIREEYDKLWDYVVFISRPVISPDGNSKVAIFLDPAGNPIELVEILKEWVSDNELLRYDMRENDRKGRIGSD